MPGRNGSGPAGEGPGTGRRRQQNRQVTGSGKGAIAGPEGFCICRACGTVLQHQPGLPCVSMICPKCKQSMTRCEYEVKN